MVIQVEDILKLLLALALGGMIGLERELRDKAAGFRTLMFISAGSALFTIFSIRVATSTGAPGDADPGRIAAQIVTGIGFLGAGVILREHGEIYGLTTAATIWLAAALGIGAGVGQYLFTTLAAVVIMLALLVFPRLEAALGTLSQTRIYVVKTPARMEKYRSLCDRVRDLGLTMLSARQTRNGEEMECRFSISGRPTGHDRLVNELFEDPEVISFEAR
jgi:putative Mg2+ transporter-C (MgtC) family protein